MADDALGADNDGRRAIQLMAAAFQKQRTGSHMNRAGREITPFPFGFEASRPRPF